MSRLLIIAVLFLTNTGSTFAFDILCAVSDESESYVTSFISALVDEADMDTVDYFDMYPSSTPSLGDLTSYDGVMTWSNNPYPDAAAWGDILADYVDGGGKLVMTTFAYGGRPGCAIQGDISDSPYSPFTPLDGAYN